MSVASLSRQPASQELTNTFPTAWALSAWPGAPENLFQVLVKALLEDKLGWLELFEHSGRHYWESVELLCFSDKNKKVETASSCFENRKKP
ncbi:hypothetical protein AC249_AIPGENE9206 [Exaiptasia diaphana]|nr:hypothetical protein AC249_AIPGENE9206 [Exaiptasia diaphana]